MTAHRTAELSQGRHRLLMANGTVGLSPDGTACWSSPGTHGYRATSTMAALCRGRRSLVGGFD